MKNIFFKKKREKIVSDENSQYFSFSKGGLIDLEWLNLPRNIVMKNTFFSKKKELEKILGNENCSIFYIFQRGVQSTQNDLICLETLSW